MLEQIVNNALENLEKYSGIKGTFTPKDIHGMDGKLDMLLSTGKEIFIIECKKEVRSYQLDGFKRHADQFKNYLLVADRIFPKMKEELRKEGIAYLDGAGNFFLKNKDRYVLIEGNKKGKTKEEKINRAFTAAGLKVTYLFLIDEEKLNIPQRTIAEEAGVSLGNINYVLNDLKEQKFIIEKGKKKFVLNNKKELLDKWIIAFDEKLKPALQIGNYRFLKNEDYNNWKNISLKKHHTFWGGEPAGAIITKYLLPEILTIYTDEPAKELIKNYKLIPDKTGNIKAFKKFWKYNGMYNDTTVHPMLVYADLINTGDRRSIETANKIYDELLRNRFQ